MIGLASNAAPSKMLIDGHFLWLLCATAIWLPRVLSFPGGDGWAWMAGAADLDGAQFRDFAYPLVEMSANAYRYPSPLEPIPGWCLSSLIAPLHPPLGGAHALAFEENAMDSALYTYNSPSADLVPDAHAANPKSAHVVSASCSEFCGDHARRVIVAFRGTQMSDSIDSLADVCADKLLWEGFNMSSLPEECLVFNPRTLDYVSQALNYTLQVISLYPSVPILLTGHSLGAGIAVLVAAALSHVQILPVIGFGAPATRKALLDRGLSIRSLGNDSIMVIGHEWDVIMRTQMEGQVGSLYFYPQMESASCKACISSLSLPLEEVKAFSVENITNEHVPNAEQSASKPISAWGRSAKEGAAELAQKSQGLAGLPQGDCMECFFETHYLKNLIAVVQQGLKPICQQARDEYPA